MGWIEGNWVVDVCVFIVVVWLSKFFLLVLYIKDKFIYLKNVFSKFRVFIFIVEFFGNIFIV